MLLSIVIPVFNEEESLRELHREIAHVASHEGYDVEIVLIDDGSRDASWSIIQQLAAEDPRVRGIKFRGNFGKAAALNAGFAEVHGDFVMTLDADLQDDPAEIPAFLAQMEEGYDVISGWKKRRHDPWHKVFPSRVFNWMVSYLTGVVLHDHNCGMKCYRGAVVKEVTLYGELHRFVPVLAAARGFRIGERVVQHRARKFGSSKYGVSRFIKGFLDLLTVKFVTGFGQRPQHIIGSLGLFSFFVGAGILAILAIAWLGSRILFFGDVEAYVHLHDHPIVLYAMALMLFGGQLLSVGMLGELVVANHSNSSDLYSVAATAGNVESASTHGRLEQ